MYQSIYCQCGQLVYHIHNATSFYKIASIHSRWIAQSVLSPTPLYAVPFSLLLYFVLQLFHWFISCTQFDSQPTSLSTWGLIYKCNSYVVINFHNHTPQHDHTLNTKLDSSCSECDQYTQRFNYQIQLLDCWLILPLLQHGVWSANMNISWTPDRPCIKSLS